MLVKVLSSRTQHPAGPEPVKVLSSTMHDPEERLLLDQVVSLASVNSTFEDPVKVFPASIGRHGGSEERTRPELLCRHYQMRQNICDLSV